MKLPRMEWSGTQKERYDTRNDLVECWGAKCAEWATLMDIRTGGGGMKGPCSVAARVECGGLRTGRTILRMRRRWERGEAYILGITFVLFVRWRAGSRDRG